MGRATEKDWPKKPSDCQLQETQNKTLIGPELLRQRQSVSLHTCCPGSCKPSSCATFTLNPHWGRAAAGKKMSCIYACRVALILSNSLQTCGLWPARLLCQGVLWQKYWSVLTNTGCHILLEHYMSRCLSCQLPRVPVAPRTPVTQAALPPPYLAFIGADPSPPGSLRI